MNPHKFGYLINQPQMCHNHHSKKNSADKVAKEEKEIITLLVMVASAAQHSDRRNAIRQTWAYSLSGVKVIFLLGQGQDQQTKIQSESELYNDIIQEDFQVCNTTVSKS